MEIKQENVMGTVYIGENAGIEIYKSIEEAKERVWIVSPYIDTDSINLLYQKEKDISTKLFLNEKELKKAINKNSFISSFIEEKIDKNKNYTTFIVLLFFVFISLCCGLGLLGFGLIRFGILSQKNAIITGISSLLFLISFKFYKRAKKTNYKTYSYQTKIPIYFIKTKYNKKFNLLRNIHSKIYLIDDVVFIGSINFTKKAFYANSEAWFKTSDEILVRNVKEYIMSLQNNEGWVTNISQRLFRISRENEEQRKKKNYRKYNTTSNYQTKENKE